MKALWNWTLIVALAVGTSLLGAGPSAATSPPLYLVLFPTDDVTLGETQKAVLDQVIADLRPFDKAALTVTGHYDRTGTQEHRLQMSRRFAEAVAHYLVANGLRKERILIAWRADEELAVPTADGVYELANRNVLITIDAPRE